MPDVIKFVDLHYYGGGSDKVYHAAIEHDSGLYSVIFAYGRRGSSLNYGRKTTAPVQLDKAAKIYDKLVAEKVGKGYQESPGVSGNIFGTVSGPATSRQTAHIQIKEDSGIVPQLCNEISEEEAMLLLEDDSWGAQEKLDGKHKLVAAGSGETKGINKKGQLVPVPVEIASAVDTLNCQVTLDGEEIGNTLHAFGILDLYGQDLRQTPYGDAFDELERLLKGKESDGLKLVPLARTTREKKALYERLLRDGKEGMVFKRLDGAYMAGKPASGGDHLKLKFWADISVIVLKVNDRRSIQVGVLDGKKVVSVGNVTIPANKDIPEVGNIVDVRYLYAYKGGSLYQPIYRGKRDDVDREECQASRIKYKAEAA